MELDERQAKLCVQRARAGAGHGQHATVGLRRALQIGQTFSNATAAEQAVGRVNRVRKAIGDALQDSDAGTVLAQADQRSAAAVVRLGSAAIRRILLQEAGVCGQRFAIAVLLEAGVASLERQREGIVQRDQLVQGGLRGPSLRVELHRRAKQ